MVPGPTRGISRGRRTGRAGDRRPAPGGGRGGPRVRRRGGSRGGRPGRRPWHPAGPRPAGVRRRGPAPPPRAPLAAGGSGGVGPGRRPLLGLGGLEPRKAAHVAAAVGDQDQQRAPRVVSPPPGSHGVQRGPERGRQGGRAAAGESGHGAPDQLRLGGGTKQELGALAGEGDQGDPVPAEVGVPQHALSGPPGQLDALAAHGPGRVHGEQDQPVRADVPAVGAEVARVQVDGQGGAACDREPRRSAGQGGGPGKVPRPGAGGRPRRPAPVGTGGRDAAPPPPPARPRGMPAGRRGLLDVWDGSQEGCRDRGGCEEALAEQPLGGGGGLAAAPRSDRDGAVGMPAVVADGVRWWRWLSVGCAAGRRGRGLRRGAQPFFGASPATSRARARSSSAPRWASSKGRRRSLWA